MTTPPRTHRNYLIVMVDNVQWTRCMLLNYDCSSAAHSCGQEDLFACRVPWDMAVSDHLHHRQHWTNLKIQITFILNNINNPLANDYVEVTLEALRANSFCDKYWGLLINAFSQRSENWSPPHKRVTLGVQKTTQKSARINIIQSLAFNAEYSRVSQLSCNTIPQKLILKLIHLIFSVSVIDECDQH